MTPVRATLRGVAGGTPAAAGAGRPVARSAVARAEEVGADNGREAKAGPGERAPDPSDPGSVRDLRSQRVPSSMARMSLIEVIKAGGWVMYPLLLSSLLVVAIIFERSFNLRASRVLAPTTVERVSGLVEGGRVDRAVTVCKEHPGMVSSIVLAGLEIAGRGEATAKEAVEDAGRHETARLSHYLTALGTIAAVAPLMGLFGTVTGMIDVFRTIAQSGVGHASELSGGISQALVTTAFGLLVAIPALVSYNYFQARVDLMVTDLERESLRVIRAVYLVSEAESGGARVGANVTGGD